MTDAVLRLVRVSKSFQETVAVHDLSLDVARGELVCLLGPSGCGKTTTLRIVAGFVAPSEGEILIAGEHVTALPPHRRDIAMVFQNYALFPHLSVAENIGFGLRNLKIPAKQREARVREMLAMVELEALRDRAPRQLSGGQQQRVALARALAIRPAVLLLDEPLSNLDAQLRMRMGEEIRALIRRLETTTVFVTHDQEEALALADRIVVMNHGRAEQAAAPKELYERPASRFVAEFIGLCNVFEGTLVASGPDGLRVRTQTGLELLAQAGEHRPALGDAVVVAVRPEHVARTDQREGLNRFAARLASSVYLGSISRHRVIVGGQEILMQCHGVGTEFVADGGAITITLDPARTHVLPRDELL